jgi:VWFA-related protein
MFDAMLAALRHLDAGAAARKVLILVGDGGDNASRTAFPDVLDAALRRDVVIYTIGLADRDDREAKPGRLRELAEVTGGEAFFPRSNEEITPLFERIARDIRSSYTLGYAPPDGTNADKRRKVEVTLIGPAHGKFRVRTRSLYIPPESGSAR